MKPEFRFTRSDFIVEFEVQCTTSGEARKLQLEFPSICNAPWTKFGRTLMCSLKLRELDGALLEIQNAGYDILDITARDNDYAIQEYEFTRD